MTSNAADGVLAKDGAALTMRGSTVRGSGGFGVRLSDARADVARCEVAGNAAGGVAAQLSTVDADVDRLEAENKLQAPVELF